MAKHRENNDDKLNKVARELIRNGDMEGAKRVVGSTSLENQRAIRDRILKGSKRGRKA